MIKASCIVTSQKVEENFRAPLNTHIYFFDSPLISSFKKKFLQLNNRSYIFRFAYLFISLFHFNPTEISSPLHSAKTRKDYPRRHALYYKLATLRFFNKVFFTWGGSSIWLRLPAALWLAVGLLIFQFLFVQKTFSAPFYQTSSSCINCHSKIEEELFSEPVLLWFKSLHASVGNSCTDCHGGNPNIPAQEGLTEDELKEIAMSEEHKFIGAPDEKDIPKICGKCHGTIYRDWRTGIHGKRTGYWNGEKERWNCIGCHNPHSPEIKKLKPEPPPVKPQDINIKSVLSIKRGNGEKQKSLVRRIFGLM